MKISENNLSYVLLEKPVGATPLETIETWRIKQGETFAQVPLAYAGRLDPMASGALLVLIGEECKQQERYHSLDKTYTIEVLFGASTDSGDVLGHVTEADTKGFAEPALDQVLSELQGTVAFPYPIFSARTVQGKPLHTWAMEGRLSEITIPIKTSTIYLIEKLAQRSLSRSSVYEAVTRKIALLPTVTDQRKALGNDFRRPTVLASWAAFNETGSPNDEFQIATLCVTCSSGTYMRTLAEVIGQKVGSLGLAYSIHRDAIGRYNQEKADWEMRF